MCRFVPDGAVTNPAAAGVPGSIENGWIEGGTVWTKMLADRNLTSHTYSEPPAEQPYGRLPNYVTPLNSLPARLHEIASPLVD